MALWFSVIDAKTGLPTIVNAETGLIWEPVILDDGKEGISSQGRRFKGSIQALALMLNAEVVDS